MKIHPARIRVVLFPLCLAFATAGFLPVSAARAADTQNGEQAQKPHGGALKGAAAGGAVGAMSGGSAKKGAAIGGTAGAVEKHESKKNIREKGQP